MIARLLAFLLGLTSPTVGLSRLHHQSDVENNSTSHCETNSLIYWKSIRLWFDEEIINKDFQYANRLIIKNHNQYHIDMVTNDMETMNAVLSNYNEWDRMQTPVSSE